MISVYKYKDVTWTDLVEPTTEEIRDVAKRYGIDPLVAHEMVIPSFKHRVESRHNYIYLILHFPAWKLSKDSKESQEVDFLIGKDFIITTRFEQIDAVDRFAKKIEVESILEKNSQGAPRDLIFFGLLNEIFSGILDQLDYIEDCLMDVQDRIFKGKEKEMVVALSEVSRHLLDFKKITAPYPDALRTLERIGERQFGEDFGFCTRGIIEEFSKGDTIMKHQMEYVAELRATNNSLLSTKESQIMKTLTLMASITLMPTLIAGIFGMNTHSDPIIGTQHDFWIVLGIMVASTILILYFVYRKKWL
jgi:magnesium transporter